MLNHNIHIALDIAQDKKVCIWALDRGACLKSNLRYILLHKLTVTGNPSMHSLHIWKDKWRQHTVSVLKWSQTLGSLHGQLESH